ncbi:LptA/OstA family protein [Kiritimatiellota bacterium B12222]|nr:LptA/OstA family protein [Kiritimatiellota bacterium B12222]
MKRIIFKLLLSTLALSGGLSLYAQPATAPAEDRITEITSDKLFFDYEAKKAIFTGNVVVTDPDLQLNADKLVVTMTAQDEIDKLEAEGSVEVKMEGLHSRSGKAIYTISNGKVVLTDRPQVSREGSVLQADKVIYWRLENRMETEGKTRVIMFSEDKK